MSRLLRPQDLVLVLLLAAMAALDPDHDGWIIGMIATLGVLQILESKIPFVSTTAGKVTWILLKLAIGFLLIGYTGGVASLYYFILVLPIFSAATALGVYATLAVSLIACSAYLSFVLFLDKDQFLEPDSWRILILRLLFLALAGNLVSALADVLREQYVRYRKLAEELAKTEAAFRRADRLAALGQLSAGLAHELRNPLGTIKASAEMLTQNLPAGNELAAEMAGFISSEVDRTNSLVTRFLDFARPLALRRELTDVTIPIRHAVDQVKREVPTANVETNFSPNLPPLHIDSEMMERVFYNLLLNAVQASPDGAPVAIRATPDEIAIADTGVGIAKEHIESVFNPFFTTKPTGTGLGLPIVSKIVDEHGGKLSVQSDPGKGTTFRIVMPLS